LFASTSSRLTSARPRASSSPAEGREAARGDDRPAGEAGAARGSTSADELSGGAGAGAGPGARAAAGAEAAAGSEAAEADTGAADADAPPGTARDAAVDGAVAPGEAELADPLAEAERRRDEYLELAQRTQADFENFRRRAARDAAAAGARAKAGLVRELLPALDNLERALAATDHADDGFAQGVQMVYGELIGALERNGVAAFEPEGEPFDPTVHEAISTRPADGAQPGTVLEVVEKGYRLDDTVLRPARVVVSA
jgi:molecular chaperone GrpE